MLFLRGSETQVRPWWGSHGRPFMWSRPFPTQRAVRGSDTQTGGFWTRRPPVARDIQQRGPSSWQRCQDVGPEMHTVPKVCRVTEASDQETDSVGPHLPSFPWILAQ